MHKLKVVFLALAIGLFGCSGGPPAGNEGTGTVGAAITLAGGVQLTSLAYSIVGPQTYSGTVPIGGSQTVQFQQADVADGTYTVSLTGTDSSGFACAGSTSGVVVTTGATATCTIAVVCGGDAGVVAQTVDAGEIQINATVSVDGGNTYCSSLLGIGVANTDLAPNANTPFTIYEQGSAQVTYSWNPVAGGGSGTGTTPLSGSCTPIWKLPASYMGPYYGESTGPASLWCPGSICGSGAFVGSYTLTASVSTGAGDPCNGQPEQQASVTIDCDSASTP